MIEVVMAWSLIRSSCPWLARAVESARRSCSWSVRIWDSRAFMNPSSRDVQNESMAWRQSRPTLVSTPT